MALTACSSKETTSSPGGGTVPSKGAIVISSAAPLTSPVYEVPEYKAGLKAAVDSINAAGGVHGHDLQLNVCDTQFTVNGEIGCARQIAAAKPSAVVAPFFVADQSGAVFKILAAAGIPVIGGQGGSPAEMNSPVVYPLGSAFMGPFEGAAEGIARAGVTSATVLCDSPNPAGSFATHLITAALKQRGIANVKNVTAYPASDPTFATAAAQATSGGVNGIVLDANSTDNAKLIKALRADGYTGKIAVPALLLPAQSIAALGAAANGVILDSTTAFTTDTSNPGIKAFLADMHKYQPAAAVDDASLQAWGGVELFARVANLAKAYDAASLITTLDHISTPIDIDVAGPWSVLGKLNTIKGFSRIVNPTVTFGTIKGGKVVPQPGGFSDPFTASGN
ncbi:ABC transporter substrate-binding protein [Streptomyces mirabilis]|uniref:ABC transporter substrate-binding protein n=1 Tax=Streptomyces mirabilis TaxID=68239 RepID=UPI0033259196